MNERKQNQHEAMLRAILVEHPSAKTKGFKKAIIAAAYQDAVENDLAEDFMDQFTSRGRARFVPDAYLVNDQEKIVVFFEVEHHSGLTPAKLHEYANTAILMDEIYWTVVLISFDIYANGKEIDLGRFMAIDGFHRAGDDEDIVDLVG